ncbi:hypothetical protein INR49_000477 [Caranx melampygus]|nr:hypothetical protein INR49_000477 [Caranx melampygus]
MTWVKQRGPCPPCMAPQGLWQSDRDRSDSLHLSHPTTDDKSDLSLLPTCGNTVVCRQMQLRSASRRAQISCGDKPVSEPHSCLSIGSSVGLPLHHHQFSHSRLSMSLLTAHYGSGLNSHHIIQALSKEDAQQAFIEYASEKCCCSNRPAEEGVITNMEAFNTYRRQTIELLPINKL